MYTEIGKAPLSNQEDLAKRVAEVKAALSEGDATFAELTENVAVLDDAVSSLLSVAGSLEDALKLTASRAQLDAVQHQYEQQVTLISSLDYMLHEQLKTIDHVYDTVQTLVSRPIAAQSAPRDWSHEILKASKDVRSYVLDGEKRIADAFAAHASSLRTLEKRIRGIRIPEEKDLSPLYAIALAWPIILLCALEIFGKLNVF